MVDKRKALEEAIRRIEEKKVKDRQLKAVQKMSIMMSDHKEDRVLSRQNKQNEKRKAHTVGIHQAIIVPLIEFCASEQQQLQDTKTEEDATIQLGVLSTTLTKEGNKLTRHKKWVYIIDESEDCPTILFWYNPRTQLWYCDLEVFDLTSIHMSKKKGYTTLGEAWELM